MLRFGRVNEVALSRALAQMTSAELAPATLTRLQRFQQCMPLQSGASSTTSASSSSSSSSRACQQAACAKGSSLRLSGSLEAGASDGRADDVVESPTRAAAAAAATATTVTCTGGDDDGGDDDGGDDDGGDDDGGDDDDDDLVLVSSTTPRSRSQPVASPPAKRVRRPASSASSSSSTSDIKGNFTLVFKEECSPASHVSTPVSSRTLLSPSSVSSRLTSSPSSSSCAKGSPYTPLEKQYMAIRDANPGVLLMVECGYKFRFFGEDAEVAARVLNIFCHPMHNFMNASIPVQRLPVHVRRLVMAGYKVGVVRQVESAAHKALSDKKGAPFERSLSELYTRATLIEQSLRSLEIFAYGFGHGWTAVSVVVCFRPWSAQALRLDAVCSRQWLAKPLLRRSAIVARHEAVEELCANFKSPCVRQCKALLSHLPDVEKGLGSIVHKKCSTGDFFSTLQALLLARREVQAAQCEALTLLQCSLLSEAFNEVPALLSGVQRFLDCMDPGAARSGDKTALFTDLSKFPDLAATKKALKDIDDELLAHRREVRLKLGIPALEYKTVSGDDYLVEVPGKLQHKVPQTWDKINSTKQAGRYRSPFIVERLKTRALLRETLSQQSHTAWQLFLGEFSSRQVGQCRQAVGHLAVLDCLLSLAKLASQPGYCRPYLLEDSEACELSFVNGWHPVVSALLNTVDSDSQFVANSAFMTASENRVSIITGPNMGGKSCFVRQVALMVIMCQMGSFVPAESARMSVLDGVFVRMGACDDIGHGHSTFMVELQETSDVLRQATPRSLVILDELGRGTSTHDGVAIAYSTLHFLITKVECLVLFVTHYPAVAQLCAQHPAAVKAFHMSFLSGTDTAGNNAGDGDAVTAHPPPAPAVVGTVTAAVTAASVSGHEEPGSDGMDKNESMDCSSTDGGEYLDRHLSCSDGGEYLDRRLSCSDGGEYMNSRLSCSDGGEYLDRRLSCSDGSEYMDRRLSCSDGGEYMDRRLSCSDGGEYMDSRLSCSDGDHTVTFLYQLVEGLAEKSYGLNVARLAGLPHDILRRAAIKSEHLEQLVTCQRRSVPEMFRAIWTGQDKNT
ncbi:DNA mismatch repair protein Msh3-like [Sycon ciliatum]|uniref:DNA mismatch repair protein Msh3-like n=1 Tax=Sycon ciliatum TaxID=27933 RepID=UPI0031F62EFC